MVDYVRVYTELVVEAEEILLAREKGVTVAVPEDTHAKFVRMHTLEKTIGRTGLSAIKTQFHIEREDLWELHMLDDLDHHRPK
jgi:hypothetical protein